MKSLGDWKMKHAESKMFHDGKEMRLAHLEAEKAVKTTLGLATGVVGLNIVSSLIKK